MPVTIENLQNEVKKLQEENSGLNKEIAENLSDITNKNTEINDLDDEIRKLKREKGQVQTNLKLAENKLKGVLGIDANGTLPKAWENQLIKKSDLTNNQTGSPQKIPTNLEDKLKEIVNKFSQERLEGVPIDLVFGKRGDKNFSNAFANTTSYTNWKNFNKSKKRSAGFYIKIRADRDKMKIYRTLAHELSHDLVMLKEDKGELHSSQWHSKTFWEDQLDWDSTLDFVLNNLDDKDREELIKLSNPSTNGIKDEEKVLSVAYFPIRTRKNNWENMTYMAKVVPSPITVDRQWELTRREVLKLADEEMNNCPPESAAKKWSLLRTGANSNEAKKWWLQIEVKLKGEKDNEGEDDKYKIYIYYDKESPIRDQLKSELCDRRGFKEKKNPINLRKRMILDQEIDDNNLVGYCGYQGDDRFDEIEPQIQIPPKSNNN